MKAWDEFLTTQEQTLGKGTVKRWLRPLRIRHFDACNLYLEAKDSFAIAWFEEHIRKAVEEQLVNSNNRKIKVHLAVNEELKAPNPAREQRAPETPPPFRLRFDEVDPHLTFDAFLASSANELAYKLLSTLGGETALGTFNPIYLQGPEGSGKSHLMMATVTKLKSQGLRTLYMGAKTFTEHVVSAIRAGEMQQFRSIYRNVDVLIIDDVEVFSRKTSTQEELFHTFNTLHIAEKQIILGSTCSPQELRAVEPRLVSRFEWGIVLPLETPPPKQLRQMLLRKAEVLSFPVASDVITYLIDTFKSRPRAAMSALEALVLRSHLAEDNLSDKHPLRLPLAKTYLLDLVEQEKRSVLTTEKIVQTVAAHYGIQGADILGKSQKKENSVPRQIAMYLCRKRLKIPFQRIGDEFERDHSTVMTSVKRVEEQASNRASEMAAELNAIEKELV